MSLEQFRQCCPAIDHLIKQLIELELPVPDQATREGPLIAVCWSQTGVTFWFEPDAQECDVIDEFDAALLNGVDPADWPYPSADGYADYVRDASR
jgi:hypothetical protein